VVWQVSIARVLAEQTYYTGCNDRKQSLLLYVAEIST